MKRMTVAEFKEEIMPRIENLETSVTILHSEVNKLHSEHTGATKRDLEMMGAIKDLQHTVEKAPVMNIHHYLSKEITKKVSAGTAIIAGIIVGLQKIGLL